MVCVHVSDDLNDLDFLLLEVVSNGGLESGNEHFAWHFHLVPSKNRPAISLLTPLLLRTAPNRKLVRQEHKYLRIQSSRDFKRLQNAQNLGQCNQ